MEKESHFQEAQEFAFFLIMIENIKPYTIYKYTVTHLSALYCLANHPQTIIWLIVCGTINIVLF